jgi:hypothetical protein
MRSGAENGQAHIVAKYARLVNAKIALERQWAEESGRA